MECLARTFDPSDTRDFGDLDEIAVLISRACYEVDGGNDTATGVQWFADGVVAFIDNAPWFCRCGDDPELCVRCAIRERLGLPRGI